MADSDIGGVTFSTIPRPKCTIHKIDMLGSPGGPYCYECDKEFEDLIKAQVLFHYKNGQRVERPVDPYDKTKGVKHGVITECYSRYQKETLGGMTLGPYPELYKVVFDDGSVGNGFFWWGIRPIDLNGNIIK
jgi:hypothetical protein